MKKHLILILALISLGSLSLVAQDPIEVSGYVTNEINGDPVIDHDVYIMVNDSNLYTSTVLTDQNGFYIDTIQPGGYVVNSIYIITNDLCTFGIHDTLIQNPGPVVTADFEICVDSVPNPECQADFFYVADSSNQNTLYFYDNSTSILGVNTWFWDFGDGNTSVEQNPVHTYNATGYYYVCLTITADSGACTSVSCEYVYINGGGNDCQADYYYVPDSSNQYTIFFFDISTAATGVDSWSWSFGDGTGSDEQNPVHTYNAPGNYYVCLTITADSGSCTSTFCDYVYISGGVDCQADFYFEADTVQPLSVHFYDLSTPIGFIDSWLWDFGDGNTSTLQNPVHSYAVPGTYPVILTITADSLGCTSTTIDSVNVNVNIQYQLGGNVFADIYQLDNGFAYAYKSENNVITDVYSEMIDTLGYYLFYPMVPADYYVKAEPSPNSVFYGQYMPTYYGDVIHWEDAVLINLSQNVYTADINLVPVELNVFGPGTISGTIEHEGSKGNTPAVDIQIMLMNNDGECVGLAYSDEEGKFEFTSLAYGTYTLMAEVMGMGMTPKDFNISEDNATVDDISMIMTDDEIYFGPSGIETLGDISLSDVYPNPVHSSLKFDAGSQDPTRISYRVVNHLGQNMLSGQVELEGFQTMEIPVGELKPGMYFLEVISQNSYRLTRRFVKL